MTAKRMCRLSIRRKRLTTGTFSLSSANLELTPQRRNWYTVMDEFAASHLGYKPSDSNRYLRPTKYGMRFLDFWNMSLKRPDAHLKPAIDCMHFCSPGVPNEWLEFMWHLMVIAADNDDYDDIPESDTWFIAAMSK